MNCTDYLDFLQNQMDGVTGDVSQAEHHLHHCAGCRELQRNSQRLLAGVYATAAPSAPADLAIVVSRRVLADLRRRQWQRRLVVSAAAAALLFAAYLGLSRQRTGPAPPTLVKLPAPAPDDESSPPSLRQSVEQAGYAVAALTRRAAGETLDQSRFFIQVALPVRHTPVDEQPAVLQEPPLEPLRAVQQGVSEGLEPVATSARRAVQLFWRERPTSGSSVKEDM
jgi:hypothetical protein